MQGLKAFLNKKEMGLPIWAWALIIAVILVVFLKLRSKSSASSSQDAATTTDMGVDSSGVGSIPSGGSDTGGGYGDITSPLSATDTSAEFDAIRTDLASLLSNQPTADTSTDGGGITPQFYGSEYDPSSGQFSLQDSSQNVGTSSGSTNPVSKPKKKNQGIWWGGKWMTSWSGLSSYLKTKGVDPNVWAAKHPGAAQGLGHKAPTKLPQKMLDKAAKLKAAKVKAAKKKATAKAKTKAKAVAKKAKAKAAPAKKKPVKKTPKPKPKPKPAPKKAPPKKKKK